MNKQTRMESLYKNKWLGIVTLVLLTANIITLVLLWTNSRTTDANPPFPPPGGGRAFEFVINELGLDEKQQKMYAALRDEHQQQQRPIADSLAKARNNYFALLKDTTVSDSQLLTYSGSMMALQQQKEMVNFKHFQKLRAICTNSQQQKFDDIIQEVLKRFAGRRPPPHTVNGERPPADGEGPPPEHP